MTGAAISEIADEYFALQIEMNPLGGSLFGIDRGTDRLPGLSLKAEQADISRVRGLERRVDAQIAPSRRGRAG